MRSGGEYYEDKMHKEFMDIYEKCKKESILKDEKETQKKENEKKKNKNLGVTMSKKFTRLMNMDELNKGKKNKFYYGSAAVCTKHTELAIEERNRKKNKK